MRPRPVAPWLTALLTLGAAAVGARLAAPPAERPSTAAAPEPQRSSAPAGAIDDSECGIAVYVGDELLRGYDPTPMLVVPQTIVQRARFPLIDIHCHWWLARSAPSATEMLAAMDRHNIVAAVNLSGGWGDTLEAMLAWCSVAPDRLLLFANLDFTRIDEPKFGAAMASFLGDAKRRGVRGLKIFKDLGLTIRDRSGGLVGVDDPRLDPIWRACGELGLPVLIHTADPAAFFEPIDARNERWMQLRRHPDWSFHGEGFPTRAELFAQRERLFARHPQTTFIAAHLGDLSEDLDAASALLEKHSNVVMDLAGRVAEIGRQPVSARRFLLRWQDRILFGTDRYPGRTDQPRYAIYARFLETADEYFKYHEHPFPPEGEWRIYGVELPDEVLRKIYFDNAARVLGIEPRLPVGDGDEPARTAAPRREDEQPRAVGDF